MSNDLKPCPHCGGEAISVTYHGATYVTCKQRHCVATRSYVNDQNAFGLWNHRPEEDRLQKRIAELEKSLKSILDALSDSFGETIEKTIEFQTAKIALKGIAK